jgi:hypothetical protein
MQTITNITVDIASQASAPIIIAAKQFDGGTRIIQAALTENGQPYTVPAGVTAMLRIKKPDGFEVVLDCTISGNTIMATLSAQALAAQGKAIAEIALYMGEDILSSFTFAIDVKRAAYQGIGESTGEYGALKELLESFPYYHHKRVGSFQKVEEDAAPNMNGAIWIPTDKDIRLKVKRLAGGSYFINGAMCTMFSPDTTYFQFTAVNGISGNTFTGDKFTALSGGLGQFQYYEDGNAVDKQGSVPVQSGGAFGTWELVGVPNLNGTDTAVLKCPFSSLGITDIEDTDDITAFPAAIFSGINLIPIPYAWLKYCFSIWGNAVMTDGEYVYLVLANGMYAGFEGSTPTEKIKSYFLSNNVSAMLYKKQTPISTIPIGDLYIKLYKDIGMLYVNAPPMQFGIELEPVVTKYAPPVIVRNGAMYTLGNGYAIINN